MPPFIIYIGKPRANRLYMAFIDCEPQAVVFIVFLKEERGNPFC